MSTPQDGRDPVPAFLTLRRYDRRWRTDLDALRNALRRLAFALMIGGHYDLMIYEHAYLMLAVSAPPAYSS